MMWWILTPILLSIGFGLFGFAIGGFSNVGWNLDDALGLGAMMFFMSLVVLGFGAVIMHQGEESDEREDEWIAYSKENQCILEDSWDKDDGDIFVYQCNNTTVLLSEGYYFHEVQAP